MHRCRMSSGRELREAPPRHAYLHRRKRHPRLPPGRQRRRKIAGLLRPGSFPPSLPLNFLTRRKYSSGPLLEITYQVLVGEILRLLIDVVADLADHFHRVDFFTPHWRLPLE